MEGGGRGGDEDDKREGYAGRERGEMGSGWGKEKKLEDKDRQTERGGRWETSCSPEASLLVSHSTGPYNV